MPSPGEASEPPGAEDAGPPFRDREPPPYFDGEDPARSFKPWLRELELWAYDTEVPLSKHGTRILRRLGGAAKAAANELETSEIVGEKGRDNIVAKLKEYFAPHLETTMPKAFEQAVYGEVRGSKESLSEYIVRMDAAFRNLRDEGVDLPSDARGYVMFRQARLSTVQEDQVTTWTEGRFGRDVVIKALRRLDKVKEQGGAAKRAYFDEGELEGGDEGEDSDFDEEYIYMEQADLQEVYDESEVKQALATYQQVRRALQDQKNARSYFPTEKPKGKGKGKKGDSRTGTGTRIHVSMLKLRTKCARCGQVGHWAAECNNPPDGYRKSGGPGSSAATGAAGPQAGGGGASKTGFYQSSSEGMDGSSAFWGKKPLLGSFLRASRCGDSLGLPGTSSFDRCDPRGPDPFVPEPESSFSGVTTKSHHGIVDSAAQDGVIGKLALERLEEDLKSRGLKPRWSNRVVRTKGIGGEARSVGVCEIPLSIGGVSGIMEAAVVEGEVPLLLPVKLLKQLRSVINLDEECLEVRELGMTLPMHRLPSGHYTIDVLDFGCKEWQLPSAAASVGRRDEEFRVEPQPVGPHRSFGGFTVAGVRGHESAATAAVRCSFVTAEAGIKWRAEPAEGTSIMATHNGQAHRSPAARRGAVPNGGLVQRVVAACLAAICGGACGVGTYHPTRAWEKRRRPRWATTRSGSFLAGQRHLRRGSRGFPRRCSLEIATTLKSIFVEPGTDTAGTCFVQGATPGGMPTAWTRTSPRSIARRTP